SRAPQVLPIPGTTSVAHLTENFAAASLGLEPAALSRAGTIINQSTIAGARYAAANLVEIDSEEFRQPSSN
ncbi:MAG TPA: aldo/keto reductase, partial [Gammaproteobacteria bacterium]|nr:aldo/keto reductase [Gammaproteobacteria bacterium]